MNILVDENIPEAHRAFGRLGNVRTATGRAMDRAALHDVDALIVRSVTYVGRELLESTPVRFVGTATVGTDHLDLQYLRARNIAVADAGGSSARTVAEYVVAALLELEAGGAVGEGDRRLGIVGVGRIGSIVSRLAAGLGYATVEFDPPRERADPSFRSATFEQLRSCSVLTLHVPLVAGGSDATLAMVNRAWLRSLRGDATIINSSRGGVVDSGALLQWLAANPAAGAVLDVWQGEPMVPAGLIERCTLATPHIAGYSHPARLRGTGMIVDALAQFLGRAAPWSPSELLDEESPIEITLRPDVDHARQSVRAAVASAYDIRFDDAALRQLLRLTPAERAAGFDRLRREYRKRMEFPFHCVRSAPAGETREILQKLGFGFL